MDKKIYEVKVNIDTSEVEKKSRKLIELLKEAKSLADEIASHELIPTFIKSEI